MVSSRGYPCKKKHRGCGEVNNAEPRTSNIPPRKRQQQPLQIALPYNPQSCTKTSSRNSHHEGQNPQVECGSDVAMGHPRGRRVRHLPSPLRRHLPDMQISRRRVHAVYALSLSMLHFTADKLCIVSGTCGHNFHMVSGAATRLILRRGEADRKTALYCRVAQAGLFQGAMSDV